MGTRDCPECGGSGEVMDWARVNSASPEPPMKRCPTCNGCGEVDDDD